MSLIDRIERRQSERRQTERDTPDRRSPWIERAKEGRLPVADKTPEKAA